MPISRIAVVAHFFYLDLAEGVIGTLKNIPCDFDLYASAPAKTSEAIQRFLRNAFPDKNIVFRTVPNRGFDIAPFVCEFREAYASYDLVLKLHTKKSSHRLWLKHWGEYLLKNLAGSPAIVDSILRMFEEDKTLGLVYPELIAPLEGELKGNSWHFDWDSCVALAERLKLPPLERSHLEFPAGSMFWFRPKALAPLFELGFAFKDFPGGRAIRRHGTLAHAIERLLVLIAKKQGSCSRAVCFEPFRILPSRSFWQRIRYRVHTEWSLLVDFLGIH